MGKRSPLTTWFLACVALAALLAPRALGSEKSATAVSHFNAEIRPILDAKCYQCHGDGANEGQIAFDALDDEPEILDTALWQRVLRNVRSGIMPPAGETRPTPEEIKTLEHWVKYEAFGLDALDPDPGRVTLRRLNRNEYGHTIHDLMGYDFRVDDNFPPDDTGHGFDNIADLLNTSPMLVEKYMRAADQIVHAAVPAVTKVVAATTIPGEKFVRDAGIEDKHGNRVPFSQAGKFAQSLAIDQAGEYRVVVEFGVYGQFEYDRGRANISFSSEGKQLYKETHVWQDEKNGLVAKFDFRRDWQPGEKDFVFEVEPLPMLEHDAEPTQPAPSEDQAADASNDDKEKAALEPSAEAIARGDFANPQLGSGPSVTRIELQIVGVTVEGPLDRERWVNPSNYTRFFSRPEPPTDVKQRHEYAREVLRSFASRAYRRPVDEHTLDRLVTLAESAYTQPDHTFEQGIQQAMIAVLCSKRFLFRVEEPASTPAGRPFALLDEYSLASRLSYLLWASLPDDELTALAERGELRKNLRPQVERMLADPKSQAFVESFVGQWLRTREVDTVDIDSRAVLARDEGTEAKWREQQAAIHAAAEGKLTAPDAKSPPAATADRPPASEKVTANDSAAGKEPAAPSEDRAARRRGRAKRGEFGPFGPPPFQLDSELRAAMRQETESYFSFIAHENRSLLELIDSDYTFLNERLARQYGIEGVKGSEMRRVELSKENHRGGILAQGSILTLTSQPNRTSPVKRGRFILDNLIGTPPPHAPPNVPALETVEQSFGGREPTVREAMEMHRHNEVCASCHARMDPLGLAMENFNALGMWRTRERGQDILTESQLVTGEKLAGFDDLRKLIVERRRTDFYRCLSEKLMIYALGRGLEYYDVDAVDRVVDRLERENGQFSALLMGVVESAPFQKQRVNNDPIAAAAERN